jgi:hypothetical protein
VSEHGASQRTRLPYGEGIFRRRYRLRGEEGRVHAELEDDFHRFGLVLEHDGETVTDVRGRATRYPWTECPGAVVPLRALRGLRLTTRPTAAAGHTSARANCTHLFDLAGLAVAHAAAGRARRELEIAVPDRRDDRTRATLHADGRLVLDWQVRGAALEGPPPVAGVGLLGSAFVRFATDTLLLRRAVFIAMGRLRDLDEVADATHYMALTRNSCHTFTDGIAERATRMRGSTLEFTSRPELLLADVQD